MRSCEDASISIGSVLPEVISSQGRSRKRWIDVVEKNLEVLFIRT